MGAACTLCGGPGKLSAASPGGDEDQWWDYASSSSDEECLVPPIPVGSDDGTVLFYWAGETPRAPREPVGFQPGQYLKYNKTGERVMVVTNHHDDVQPYYTIRMQDDGIRQTVCEHLSPWDENGVECPKRVNSFVDTAAVGAVNHTAGMGLPALAGCSINEDTGSDASKPKKKGIRFDVAEEVHEFDKNRAANTHLSLEKPLELPFVPPNSLRSGFHWGGQIAEAANKMQDGDAGAEGEDDDSFGTTDDEASPIEGAGDGAYDVLSGFDASNAEGSCG